MDKKQCDEIENQLQIGIDEDPEKDVQRAEQLLNNAKIERWHI